MSRMFALRLAPNIAVGTSYGTAYGLQPAATLGDRKFNGILSTIIVRLSGLDSNEVAITTRLTEDAEGDLTTMCDCSAKLTKGLTDSTKGTAIYKYEAQFTDEYPLNIFVKTAVAGATLDEVILLYRQVH